MSNVFKVCYTTRPQLSPINNSSQSFKLNTASIALSNFKINMKKNIVCYKYILVVVIVVGVVVKVLVIVDI